MAKKNREELEAFAQKMHDEGAAGFAAGLTPWETWDDFEDRVGSRVWQGTAKHVADQERPTRSFGDRVLTAMTVLAIATLAIGIAGVYTSHNPAIQLADNSTQLLPATPLDLPDIRPSRAAGGGEAYVAQNDVSIPAVPDSPAAGDIMTNVTATASAAPSIDQGSDTSRFGTPVEGDNMLATLEGLAAAAGDAIPAAPPAGQTAGMVGDTSLPVASIAGNNMAASPRMQATASVAAASPTPGTDRETLDADLDMEDRLTLAALNNLPAPAAGTTDEQPSASIAKVAAPETMPAETGNGDTAQPVHLTKLTDPGEHAKPPQAAGQDIKQNAQSGNRGDWSINLASYTKKSTAEKMRYRFLDKGVVADQSIATVNGKTYYRLRVTGFESKHAAMTRSAIIKEKLGLKEAWVTRQ